MQLSVLGKIAARFSRNEKIVRKLDSYVKKINKLEPAMEKLSDEKLRAKTDEFKQRLANGETLDDILVEAFAVVREASKRTLRMRHFDVQLKGGIVLHRGMIAEMKTGEGKTLVATLPIYLNALSGKGAHVVTVNDYLARRDSREMGRIYKFLGLSVGCIVNGLADFDRKEQYACDITYGTNNEFGFDYLRDNMKFELDEMCQRELNYAIVDEVDSILIDEARTPLIISGASDDSSDLYITVNKLMQEILPEDYEKEEKSKSVVLTDKGHEHIEKLVNDAGLMSGSHLYQTQNTILIHHINQALKANIMFHKDVDYIVATVGKKKKILIIDEFTGRALPDRRYSDGLHQALEAKEGLKVESENQTLASITFQNFFTMYKKLAGMTGTALTESHEFSEMYKLQVIAIPTNKPMIRNDMDDEIFRTFAEKLGVVVAVVGDCQKRGQPVLVGTISIEKSEIFSNALTKAGIKHNVLNARHHEQEAEIIANAGIPGSVTIATNMAGRGTDIKLGGNVDMLIAQSVRGIEDEEIREKISKEVRSQVLQDSVRAKNAGGLFVIGTERHESRRIDNQLRGRSGRQGDPGASKFFISLEDDLMRIFGPSISMLDRWFQKMDLENGEPIQHPWISKSIEKAQQRVEAHNFDIRKHLLKYSSIPNQQRSAVYKKRLDLMSSPDMGAEVRQMAIDTIASLINLHTDEKSLPDNWDIEKLNEGMNRIFNIEVSMQDILSHEALTPQFLQEILEERVMERLGQQEKLIGEEHVGYIQRAIILRTLDSVWKEHLNLLEYLYNGIHLQSYGQKDPLNVYKQEAFTMFNTMIAKWRETVLAFLFNFYPQNSHSSEVASDLLRDDDGEFDSFIYDHPEEAGALVNELSSSMVYNNNSETENLDPAPKKKKASKTKEKEASSSETPPSAETRKKKQKNIAVSATTQKNNVLDDEKTPRKKTIRKKPSPKNSEETAVSGTNVSGTDRKKPKTHDKQPKSIGPGESVSHKMASNFQAPGSRNAPCPCGSGLRYKHCHGKLS
ncbi:preprotein translocase subunit SecA [Candidatus Hydrogenosomobacter endosymbioticus]|uniref:Protein translocase subunit SecA n=1 Tax=Candidatus Hydrogenosomobacter endosymbioticus TaxID=2558174 RepID=A0ABM7V8W7_9PROT|nr:preprotein translocase subunit SecA [Candidatus Hydrogenosomobacter endosymbioticus]BDB95933.1 protein translocase subunit SecA [Candidatus Hydrogenosomobacter endosymbioticus]